MCIRDSLSGQLFIISTRNAAILIQMLQQFFSPLLQCQFGMRDIGRCFPFQLHRLKAVAEFTADTQVYILKMHGRRANILFIRHGLVALQ